jgi:hypothetical protein
MYYIQTLAHNCTSPAGPNQNAFSRTLRTARSRVQQLVHGAARRGQRKRAQRRRA